MNTPKTIFLDKAGSPYFYVSSLARREGKIFRAGNKFQIAYELGIKDKDGNISVERMLTAYTVQQFKTAGEAREAMRRDLEVVNPEEKF